jgi:hypothetical protein
MPYVARVERPEKLQMPKNRGRIWRRFLALLTAVVCFHARANPAESIQPRTSHGGNVTWHFNHGVLDPLGIRIGAVMNNLPQPDSRKKSSYQHLQFPALDPDALQLNIGNGLPRALTGGQLSYRGGMVLQFPGGQADLRAFALRPRVAAAPFALDIVDHQGHVWFVLDHGHYLIEDDGRSLALRYMNVRLSAYFAQMLQRPELNGLVVGGMDAISKLAQTDSVQATCSAPWPGQSGAQANIRMVYQASDAESGVPDGIHFMRCGLPNGSGSYTLSSCTSTSTDHYAVFSPDTSLLNVGSAAVPWHKMFSGPFAPYGNDQHPFLIWNLYRMNADGSLRQLAASGVKHAFNTINKTCGCSDSQNNYPTCEDSYSNYSNDIAATQTPNYLGPRSEIIPAAGKFGRCQSVFDPNCLDTQDANGGAQDDFQYRVVIAEREITASLQPGATFYFEYWYVVRDQVDIYNAMGYRPITFSKNAQGLWTGSPGTFVSGPVINAWVNPTSPTTGTMNQQLLTSEGRARFAVTTNALGAGLYRYNYTVMNLDFSRAVIDAAHPSEPSLHVLSSDGFSAVNIPISASATISNVLFEDADDDAGNDWTVTQTANALHWQAPSGHPLNWGTLYHFAFTANRAPLPAQTDLGVATAGSPTGYSTTTLAPLDDVIFSDGFATP